MTAFEPDGIYAGIPYRVLPDNTIEALMAGGLVKFKHLDQFMSAMPAATSVEMMRSFNNLGQAATQNSYLPARPVDYYSLLRDAIKNAQTDSAQLRALVYERARFNFKRDILFGHSSMGLADLVRQVNNFEMAVARIEATSDLREPAPATRQDEYEIAGSHEDMTAADTKFDDQSKEAPIEPEDRVETSPSPSSKSVVEVLTPRRVSPVYEQLAPIRARDFSYYASEPPSYQKSARKHFALYSLLAFGLLLIASVVVIETLLWLPSKAPQQVKAVQSPPQPAVAPATPSAPETAQAPPAPAPQPSPPKLPYPLPTSFGIYALNDNKLTELHSLPIIVPDPRIALSAEIKEPGSVTVSGDKPAFILFRRDFRNKVPQKISLRVIARMVRETKIVDGKATVNQLEGPWRIRNISRDLNVSPVPGEPEMLIARLDDGASLDPGRYALVLNGAGYDFTVGGTVQSKDFCLEGFETINGTVFTPCKKL